MRIIMKFSSTTFTEKELLFMIYTEISKEVLKIKKVLALSFILKFLIIMKIT